MDARTMRSRFLAGLWAEIRIVWPIVSGLFILIAGLGCAVGAIEGWRVTDSIYFAFVSGLTIGYGDLVPTGRVSRLLAIGIGFCGILVTALLAAVAVKALSRSRDDDPG